VVERESCNTLLKKEYHTSPSLLLLPLPLPIPSSGSSSGENLMISVVTQ
jgi:hypothetical protein